MGFMMYSGAIGCKASRKFSWTFANPITRSGVALAMSSTLGLKNGPPMVIKLLALAPKKCGSCPNVSLTATGWNPSSARISSQSETRQAIRVGGFDRVMVVLVASVKVRLLVFVPLPVVVVVDATWLLQDVKTPIMSSMGRRRKNLDTGCTPDWH